MSHITRTREQIAANKTDYEIYHLALRAEKEHGREWKDLAKALHALRPIVRAKMHPADFEATKG